LAFLYYADQSSHCGSCVLRRSTARREGAIVLGARCATRAEHRNHGGPSCRSAGLKGRSIGPGTRGSGVICAVWDPIGKPIESVERVAECGPPAEQPSQVIDRAASGFGLKSRLPVHRPTARGRPDCGMDGRSFPIRLKWWVGLFSTTY
jgi:hypothetical protein